MPKLKSSIINYLKENKFGRIIIASDKLKLLNDVQIKWDQVKAFKIVDKELIVLSGEKFELELWNTGRFTLTRKIGGNEQ